MRKKKLLIGIYSFFLAALPVIDIYKSPIPNITLGELILILFSLGILIRMIRNPHKVIFGKNNIRKEPLMFFLSIFLLTLFSLLFLSDFQYSLIDIFNRLIRLLLWAVTISFTGYYLFNFENTKKWIVRISGLGSIYIIFQNMFWYGAGISLPSLINTAFLSPSSIGYLEYERLNSYYREFYYRPSSFFEEPESLSIYLLLGIILVLFSTSKKGKIHYLFLFLSNLGIILSTSTTGIYLLIMVWGFYFFSNIKSLKFKLNNVVIIFSGFIIFFGILSISLALVNNFIIESILSKPLNFSDSSRLGGSFSLFNSLEYTQKYIGAGFGNEDYFLHLEGVYYNSFTVILLSGGYVGVIIFAVFAFKTIFDKKNKLYLLSVVYVLLCITGGMLYSSLGILYLTLSYYSNKKERF